MATERKLARIARKRSASGRPITTEQNYEQVVPSNGDIADDHDFIAPYEICLTAIGLLFCLTVKHSIGISFSGLYQRSEKRSWIDLLTRERRNLKPNVISIEKCLMLNRLIAEYNKNPVEFIRRTTQLYEEIKTYTSCTAASFSTNESLFNEIKAYQNLQCQRRLFYVNHDHVRQSENIISLQRAMSELYSQFIHSCKTNPNYIQTDAQNHLKALLQHSFIIVTQPSTPESVAATKYEKSGNTYSAKLSARIICLLGVDQIDAHFTLSNIAVTLYSLDRQLEDDGEIQSALEWKRRNIVDAQGLIRSFYYAEVQSINLTKLDLKNARPFYSSKLCQLQFHLKIRMKNYDIEEETTFLSRPFGLCSHAQYFPDYTAKVLIYEIEQIPRTTNIIPPNIVTDFICRHHTRITGVKPKPHTEQFILQQSQATYEARKPNIHFTSVDIYEGILSKLINQIEFFVDHPYLSMMYEDCLFLGICNSKVDNEINGTSEQPQILLRFNSLAEHQSCQQASVRYIVHDGRLIKATFHTKAFVDEMCRVICESNSENAKTARILSDVPNRIFHDFSLYFDTELYRLSTISPPTKVAYNPLIPVLWSTMRSTKDNQMKQLSNAASTTSNDKVIPHTDKLIQLLVEKLPEMLLKLQMPPPHSTYESSESRQLIASNLLRDYLQSVRQIQASATEMIDKQNDTKSYISFCSTSTNT